MSNLAIFGQLGFCPILVLIHSVHAEKGELHSMWLVLSGPSWTIIHSQYRARCHAAPVLLRDVSQIFHLFWVIFKVIWAMMCLPLTSLRPHGWSWLYRLYPGMWRVMWVMHSNATLEKCHKSHRKNAADENWENIHASYKKSETIEVKNTQKRFTILVFGHTNWFWCCGKIFFCKSRVMRLLPPKKPPHTVLLRSSATSFRATPFRFRWFALETKKDVFSLESFCFPFSGTVLFLVSKTQTEKNMWNMWKMSTNILWFSVMCIKIYRFRCLFFQTFFKTMLCDLSVFCM